MVNKCKYCDKDISGLSPQKKGYHVANCNSNPNYKFNLEKRTLTRLKNKRLKNPIIKLKLICLNCNKKFEIDIIESYYKKGKYKKCCCKKCAKTYSSHKLNRENIKKSICKKCDTEIDINILSIHETYCEKCKILNTNNTKILKHENIVCKFCGDEICKRPDICRKFRQKNNIFVKYLNFDINKYGKPDFYKEFDKIIDKLKIDYVDNEFSFTELGKKYHMNFQTLHMLFKDLNIKSRSFSDAQYVLFKQGKNISHKVSKNYQYKTGYHITWDDKKIHYRSSYEKEYYKILDDKKIEYTVESLRLPYYDTQKQKNRIAIPDIYIKNNNEIIEIKSKWTLDEINMSDKILAYKKLGYNVRIIIGEGKRNFFKNSNERKY
jgi:hypothetical protein